MAQSKSFILEDPRPIQQRAPYTFFLPDPRCIDALMPGDAVQLTFNPTAKGTTFSGERMWATIKQRDGGSFVGVLHNVPHDVPGLEFGEIVEFQAWHIISTEFSDPIKENTLRFPATMYWDRCLVDRSILEKTNKIEYIYRELPDLAKNGDKYPDSGWRIRSDSRGRSDKELEDEGVAYVALGAVLNKDDSWLPLINEPIGSQFVRDWEQGYFVSSSD